MKVASLLFHHLTSVVRLDRQTCDCCEWKKIMQTHLLVGPIPLKGCRRFSPSFSGDLLPPSSNPICRDLFPHRRRHRDGRSRSHRNRSKTTITCAAFSSGSNTGGQNHYAVLGVARNATQVDIKKAYRLLARKVKELKKTARLVKFSLVEIRIVWFD